jgi:superfamily II DNA or RNA helicase
MSKIFQHTGRLFALIAVPYQALADQWVRELKNVSVQTILCSSVNSGWPEELAQKVDSFRTSKINFASAVVVNATLITPRFQHVISRLNNSDEFLFIGDECHHHGTLRIFTALPENAGLRLGLSATYERYGDEEGTTRLQQYYGPEVDSYLLSQAIEDGFLVPYEYHLELVDLNEEESEQYCAISDRIRERLKTLRKENPEGLFDDELIRLLLFSRARLLGKIESKRVRLGEIIDSIGLKNRTLIYCGEGSAPDGIDDNTSDEELQNIDLVTRIVSSRGYRVTKFTSRESQDARRQALEGFRNGSIQVLTAIRCLDEGIDIPSCETAFVLASSRNPRQFIQRRGRILRRSPDKTRAILWDFLPLPPGNRVSSENLEKSLLRREIGRISEFSRNSLNFKESYVKLTALLDRFDLGADFVLGGEDTK